MGNWLTLGPIRLRIGSKHLASWGYPRLAIGGLSFWSRDTAGRRHIAAYHPKTSLTWHWFVAAYRSPGAKTGFFNLERRKGDGQRGVCLFGWTLSITRQSWHRKDAQR